MPSVFNKLIQFKMRKVKKEHPLIAIKGKRGAVAVPHLCSARGGSGCLPRCGLEKIGVRPVLPQVECRA